MNEILEQYLDYLSEEYIDEFPGVAMATKAIKRRAVNKAVRTRRLALKSKNSNKVANAQKHLDDQREKVVRLVKKQYRFGIQNKDTSYIDFLVKRHKKELGFSKKRLLRAKNKSNAVH